MNAAVNPREFKMTFKPKSILSPVNLGTRAVVGNGGILADSGCGEMIDSAQFVIRCNLPPLGNGYGKDVGVKTELVTTNPTILDKKYEGLMKYHRPFVEDLRKYGHSLVLLGPFAIAAYKAVSLRAVYTIEVSSGISKV